MLYLCQLIQVNLFLCYERQLDINEEREKGLKEKSSLLDCLWCELYGSINCAEINEKSITHEHAQYLRDKYL